MICILLYSLVAYTHALASGLPIRRYEQLCQNLNGLVFHWGGEGGEISQKYDYVNVSLTHIDKLFGVR